MSSASTRHLIVGTDGSTSAARAALWAAEEANRRGASIHLIHAYWNALAGPNSAAWTDPAEGHATAVLSQAESALRKAFPTLAVTTALLHQHPVAALAELAPDAEMIVLGAHGLSAHSANMEFLLGSIASRAVSHLPGVVIIVRDGDLAPNHSGSVLVGVDGSPTSDAALGFAFEEAALWQVGLTAIRVWDDSAYRASPWSHGMIATDEHIEAEERVLLDQQLSSWRLKFPDVFVTPTVLHGRPATAILDRVSSNDQLRSPSMIVVGSRGHSGLAGRLAGSTSNSLITQASCPVAVVHPPEDRH